MFANLSEKLQDVLGKLRKKGKLTEADLDLALREVRLAFLEADVSFKVVKDFIKTVKAKALGQEILESLTPGQQVIKIVNDELCELMGGTESKITISSKPPTVVMLVGLQGAGKTTTAGKLANSLMKQGKKPLLIAGDVYRPAAIKQLQVLGEKLKVPVFAMGDKLSPVDIAKAGIEQALSTGRDLVIIDTAGRLHINEELMNELKDIKQEVHPHEILLVVDSMTGQDAVNVAESFDNALGVDGLILTKLDGDARGGAALSIKAVTGKPIKFVGLGEKLDALEIFHPDRMASRILGMGDMLTLIEKAQANFDQSKAEKLHEKLKTQSFNLEDFLDQMRQMSKMGPLEDILAMMPGMGNLKQLKNMKVDAGQMKRVEAIICSMTREERQKPEIVDGSRRKRIAAGSGTTVQEVNRLLKQFDQARKMMKQLTNLEKLAKKGGILPFLK
ncbi:MAG: signal recognition particle protein [bacterium]